MGLTIEISFSVSKNANVTQFKQYLSNLAKKYNALSHYFIHEIEGHNTIVERNDCIHVVEFSTSKNEVLNYIKTIMQLKNIKIDSIYHDTKGIDLIYASKNYLSMMSINRDPINKPITKPITKSNLLQLVADTIA